MGTTVAPVAGSASWPAWMARVLKPIDSSCGSCFAMRRFSAMNSQSRQSYGGIDGREPQPGSDRLDRAIFALRMVWFGLFSGSLILTVVAVAVITAGGGAMLDLREFKYVFLVPVPLLLIGAFAIVPQMISTDPVEVIE